MKVSEMSSIKHVPILMNSEIYSLYYFYIYAHFTFTFRDTLSKYPPLESFAFLLSYTLITLESGFSNICTSEKI